MTSPNQILDGFIDKFIDNFFPEDAKKSRVELLADRKKKKDAREAAAKAKLPPILSQITRRRILDLESDNESDEDDDSWHGGFHIALSTRPDSPYSTSSVVSFLSNHSDMLSTPNASDVEYNFSSDSDDDSYQPGQDIGKCFKTVYFF